MDMEEDKFIMKDFVDERPAVEQYYNLLLLLLLSMY